MEVPFHRPDLTSMEQDAVLECLKSGWLTTGPRTKGFEKEFAEYIGVKHAIALNSCTAALHLALDAIGTEADDIVLTTPMTFAATAEVVRYFNATPVFVDIEPDTMNIDPAALKARAEELRKAGKAIRAIMPVHFAGHPCEMDSIMQTARSVGAPVIEDAAHILPGEYKGRRIGTIGDITAFSFYATKNITTGEGGMLVTDNDAWAERARIMSLHGISRDAWKRYSSEGSWYYEVTRAGYKYNLTDIASAIGSVQLKRMDELYAKRLRIAQRYTEAFGGCAELSTPVCRPHVLHAWHLYVLRLNLERLRIDRAVFIDELKKRGVFASVHFIPLHIHPYYREKYGYRPEDLPVAYGEYQRTISLPIFPGMTEAEIEHVVSSVLGTIKDHRA